MSAPSELPRGPLRYLLGRLLPRGLKGEAIRGDLLEEFRALARKSSLQQARSWYRRQAARVLWAVVSRRISRGQEHRSAPGISLIDLKLALRMLVKHPGLTVVALLTLAVGIPVGLAPIHFVRAIEAPPPVDESDGIQALRNSNLETSSLEWPSLYDFREWQDALTSFEALAASKSVTHNVLSDDGRAAPVAGVMVTSSFFDILRVPPLHGRTLNAADQVLGAPLVAVIGPDTWRSRFGGDTEVVGQSVDIGGVPHTVVGVMPEGFRFPLRFDLWLPLRESASVGDGHGAGSAVVVFGRLADGVSAREAQVELSGVGRRMSAALPETHTRLDPQVMPYTIGLLGMNRGGLLAMPSFYAAQLAMLLLLIVPCGNIGMLILARTATRTSELAVRTALGASRGRILTQLLVESFVLAVLGAGTGLLIVDRIFSRDFARMAENWPPWIDLGVGPSTVLWALALAAFSAAVIGVAPALKATGKNVQLNMQRAAAGRSGIRFGGISSVVIVVDVAVAVGMIGPSVADWGLDLTGGMGIQADQYLAVQLDLPRSPAGSDAPRLGEAEYRASLAATQLALVRRVEAEPGVGLPAVASVLPGMGHTAARVEVDAAPPDDVQSHFVHVARVDPGFFDALEQPIIAGRGFDSRDIGDDRSTVIVNTTFSANAFGGRNPIGRRIRTVSRSQESGPWLQIVGVVGHLGMNGDDPQNDAGMYHPVGPGEASPLHMAIRIGEDPGTFTARLRSLAAEIDPAAVIRSPIVLSDVFNIDFVARRWGMWAAVAAIAVLFALSTLGIYALMSLSVTQRQREIAIRIALGAGPGSVWLSVARRALTQLGTGVAFGMVIATLLVVGLDLELEAGQTMTSSPVLVAFLTGIALMVLIGMSACTVPTLRALRIEPTEALKEGG